MSDRFQRLTRSSTANVKEETSELKEICNHTPLEPTTNIVAGRNACLVVASIDKGNNQHDYLIMFEDDSYEEIPSTEALAKFPDLMREFFQQRLALMRGHMGKSRST